MRVCVQGLWHLGPVTAACLASVGHDVAGLDFDRGVIRALEMNQPPVAEPGLVELIKSGLDSGRLKFFISAEEALRGAELLWVAYDTPVDEDDKADVDFVMQQVARALPHAAQGATVLVSSQLPAGSIGRLEDVARKLCPEKSLGFAYSPENLRLGRALDVFLRPDRIIVGARTFREKERVSGLLRPITDKIEWMSVESAEMTKHAINSFLAASVVFANEIASVCEEMGADAKEVERGLKSESRIGPKAYLSPGGAFAGGTLARDVEFLKKIGAEKGLSLPLLKAIRLSNDQHKDWVRKKIRWFFPELEGVPIAVWGLTYKPGTDTLRRSLAVELCDWLLSQGAILNVHDPAAKELPASWGARVRRVSEPSEVLVGARALIVATEWPQYKEVSHDKMRGLLPKFLILDANRFAANLRGIEGARYVAVGAVAVPG